MSQDIRNMKLAKGVVSKTSVGGPIGVDDLMGEDIIESVAKNGNGKVNLNTAAIQSFTGVEDTQHSEPKPKKTSPRKRNPPAPKIDAEGIPIPKATGKAQVNKEKNIISVNAEKKDTGNASKTAATKIVKKCSPITLKTRKEITEFTNNTEGDGEGEESEPEVKNPVSNSSRKRTSSKAKVQSDEEMPNVDDAGISASSTADIAKKALIAMKQSDRDSATVTPARKRNCPTKEADDDYGPKSEKKSKTIMAIPTSRENLSDCDKAMLEMKKNGHSWAEIEVRYNEISGKLVLKSTLQKRWQRLNAALTEWKSGDIERMLHCRETVEQDNKDKVVAFQKQLELDTWTTVAALMPDLGGDSYSIAAITKAFDKEKKAGFPHKANINAVIFGNSSERSGKEVHHEIAEFGNDENHIASESFDEDLEMDKNTPETDTTKEPEEDVGESSQLDSDESTIC